MGVGGQLVTGTGGWTCWQPDAPHLPVVFVRFRPTADGRRVEADEIYFGADEPITPATLRAIPLGQIEAMANDPDIRSYVVGRRDLPGPDLRRAAHSFATNYGRQDDHWVKDMQLAQVPTSRVPQAPIEPLPPPSFLHDAALYPRPLVRPARGEDPDQFYAAVAKQYRAAVRVSSRPAVELAQQSGVPVTTVHRWVREARRRGHLGAAHQGKAG